MLSSGTSGVLFTNITQSLFASNTANVQSQSAPVANYNGGGAVYLSAFGVSLSCSVSVQTTNSVFMNNTALVGNNIAGGRGNVNGGNH